MAVQQMFGLQSFYFPIKNEDDMKYSMYLKNYFIITDKTQNPDYLNK